MKKGLMFLLGIVSFLGINTVSADTTNVLSNYYDYFEEYIDDYNTYKENIDYMINYWEENYSSSYPYYVVVEHLDGLYTTSTGPAFKLAASSDNYAFYNTSSIAFESDVVITFDSDTGEYYYDALPDASYVTSLFYLSERSTYQEYNVLLSNGVVSNIGVDYLIPTYFSETLNFTISEIKLKKGVNYPGLINIYDGTYDYNIDDLAPELELEDVISSPLDALSKVKDSIVGIFNTITEFISLLPETMQTFLYLSFTVAIILGLLKIIL